MQNNNETHANNSSKLDKKETDSLLVEPLSGVVLHNEENNNIILEKLHKKYIKIIKLRKHFKVRNKLKYKQLGLFKKAIETEIRKYQQKGDILNSIYMTKNIKYLNAVKYNNSMIDTLKCKERDEEEKYQNQTMERDEDKLDEKKQTFQKDNQINKELIECNGEDNVLTKSNTTYGFKDFRPTPLFGKVLDSQRAVNQNQTQSGINKLSQVNNDITVKDSSRDSDTKNTLANERQMPSVAPIYSGNRLSHSVNSAYEAKFSMLGDFKNINSKPTNIQTTNLNTRQASQNISSIHISNRILPSQNESSLPNGYSMRPRSTFEVNPVKQASEIKETTSSANKKIKSDTPPSVGAKNEKKIHGTYTHQAPLSAPRLLNYQPHNSISNPILETGCETQGPLLTRPPILKKNKISLKSSKKLVEAADSLQSLSSENEKVSRKGAIKKPKSKTYQHFYAQANVFTSSKLKGYDMYLDPHNLFETYEGLRNPLFSNVEPEGDLLVFINTDFERRKALSKITKLLEFLRDNKKTPESGVLKEFLGTEATVALLNEEEIVKGLDIMFKP
ncbi:hypothetical protein CDIK_2336 [Cucumispora dikerogammari]|nr:hypothetical protein CDIK_2336 [Cucumispora dikerogammari]